MNVTTVVQYSTAGPERDHDITTGEMFSAGGAAPRPLILMLIHGGDVRILVECAPENRVRTGWLVALALRDRLVDGKPADQVFDTPQ